MKDGWRADGRGLHLDRAAHAAARARRTQEVRAPFDRAKSAQAAAHIEKMAFTRADLVEVIVAQLPVDLGSSPREVVEDAVEEVGMRLSAPPAAPCREGHERFTLDRTLAEEVTVLDPADTRDDRMVGTDDLRQPMTATTTAGAKTVLVGDAHQLAPVKARGGMFAQVCADLPWAQQLWEV